MTFFQNKNRFLPFLLLTLIFSVGLSFSQSLAQQESSAQSIKTDSLQNPRQAYYLLRGISRDEAKGFNPLSPVWNTLIYIPRQLNYLIRSASGYGFRFLKDPQIFNTFEDFFFSDNRNFGWYPVVTIVSSFRPRIGVHIFYDHKNVEALLKAKIADEEKYKTEAIFSYQFKTGKTRWRLTLSGLVEYDDDREFYGIGANPLSDSRSFFLENRENDHGIFFQRRQKIRFIFGFRPYTKWRFFLTNYYQRRKLEDPFEGGTVMSQSFDINNLPGMSATIKHVYNEVAVRFDTKKENLYNARGISLEGYLGISSGVGKDRSKLLRTGFTISSNFPVIQKNRMIIPRLTFDMIKNINNNVPIPFTEYPRQPSFRGVSSRKILRTDNLSFVPSLEYKWPLSFNLGGHFFADYLIVTEHISDFSIKNAPWAIGLGIDFHGIDEELARIHFILGSEGFRLNLNIGFDPLVKNRSDWQ